MVVWCHSIDADHIPGHRPHAAVHAHLPHRLHRPPKSACFVYTAVDSIATLGTSAILTIYLVDSFGFTHQQAALVNAATLILRDSRRRRRSGSTLLRASLFI